ncbi:TetR/AcrR family transcriptional regulator [Rhizobium leguminosarum]|uniref:TetR/AcrR family transcriptional regulator n=1 Tax=Rhizobium leguminosarum TaxID=384 RepID=A0A444I7S8_RHILE|nr:TetR/AcrR family transcriptional regulator [Rhizobium leguminosarum]RWX34200.1 TetR/AcrR family transcriptional regulator [Rhizobium leguminosarum]
MARTKEFNQEKVLEIAINVFGEHGYAGTSTGMLTGAMGIGRQSLYDTFGDKWQLYCRAMQRYADNESVAHLAALQGGERAIDGIAALLGRVVDEAKSPCLGVSSISEFGGSKVELNKMHQINGQRLHKAIAGKLAQAKEQGDCRAEHDVDILASFVLSSIAAIRLSARGGASGRELSALGQLALRALA